MRLALFASPSCVIRVLCAVCALSALPACEGPRGEPSTQAIDPRTEPRQTPLAEDDVELSSSSGVRITPRARYEVVARVLSRERYYTGWASKLSPLDLALGWGVLSDAAVDEHIEWHQSGRWYFWYWDEESPYRNEAIRHASANVHIVPASRNLRSALLSLEASDVVRLAGLLIDMTSASGERLSTSLSRTDRGSGSCEVLYVTELDHDGMVYR